MYVDGEKLTYPVIHPEPEDIIFIPLKEQKKIDEITFIPTAPKI